MDVINKIVKIELHQQCIEILEAINFFKKMTEHTKINFNSSEFFIKKMSHKNEIYNKCINRLELRYKKIVEQL